MVAGLRIGSRSILSRKRVSDNFDGAILAAYGCRYRSIIPTD
jgi:hypothetical protein